MTAKQNKKGFPGFSGKPFVLDAKKRIVFNFYTSVVSGPLDFKSGHTGQSGFIVKQLKDFRLRNATSKFSMV